MKQIKLYSRQWCSWCIEAKEYLKEHNLKFVEIDVGKDRAAWDEMLRISKQDYVPVIDIDGQVLANFDTGQLEKFLAELNEK